MTELAPEFQKNEYLFRKKVFKLFGGAFHIYDKNDDVTFYSEQKAFKLKEDFKVFDGEDMNRELLRIKTDQILDISAKYDVYDSVNNETVGSLKREGLSSFVRDKYIILDKDDQEIGRMEEDSLLASLFRRFGPLGGIFPQTYYLYPEDAPDDKEHAVTRIQQSWNPFVLKYQFDLSDLPDDSDQAIDRRLIIAAGILLCGIEGDQN